MPVLRALLDAWKEDLRYRLSRVKARMKFMVDDRGPEGMREEVERRLGYALPDFTLEPLDHEPADHMGVEPEHDPASARSELRCTSGLISGDQMLAVAELAQRRGPGHPSDTPAEPRRHGHRRRRRRLAGARGDRISGRREPPALECDRLHRRAALQLRRRRDERAARRPDRAPRRTVRATTSPSCASTSTAAPMRAGSTGSAISASRERRCGTPRASGTRGTTSSCEARSVRWRRSAAPCSAACRPRSSTRPSSD